MTYEESFRAAHPKALDFTKAEFEAAADEILAAARVTGYRLVGHRFGFVVLSTKPPVDPANPQGDALG